jgi:hypothetical protein
MFRRAILLPADSQRGISCVAFRNLRPWSFCRLRRQIPKVRVARIDDAAFATPPSPKSGKLCPIVTQFRVHPEYFHSDPLPDVRTTPIPRAGHAEESCLSRNQGSPQSPAFPYAPPTNYLHFQQNSRFIGLSPLFSSTFQLRARVFRESR